MKRLLSNTNIDRIFSIVLFTALGMMTLYFTGMLYFFFHLAGF